jgi:hypothetical protein
MFIILRKYMHVLAFIGLCTTQTTSYALSEDTAFWVPLAVGGCVGLGTGALTYAQCKDSEEWQKYFLPAVVGGASAFITAGILSVILNTFTPTSRYAAAEKILIQLGNEPLLTRIFASHNELASYTLTRFTSSWPLVETRNTLQACSIGLSQAKGLLNEAYYEAMTRPKTHNYAPILQNYSALTNKISMFASRFEECMKQISTHPQYMDQIKVYEKHIEAERERQHQSNLHYQTLAHASAMQAQQQAHEREREKERQNFQANVLETNPDRPINLNVG